jgi:hypothetical protein
LYTVVRSEGKTTTEEKRKREIHAINEIHVYNLPDEELQALALKLGSIVEESKDTGTKWFRYTPPYTELRIIYFN